MKNLIYLFAVLFLVEFSAEAQLTALDEVYLKDGSIIVGQIQTITEEHYKITVAGGSLLAIKRSETDSLKLNSRQDNWMSPSGKMYVIDHKGWYNRTSFGLTIGRSQSYNGSGESLFFTNVTGYKVNRYLQPGLAIDAEASFDQLSPYSSISAHVEGEILRGPASPYYFGQLGYGMPMGAPGQNVQEEAGGLSSGLGVGLKFYGEQRTLWFIQLAYRYQKKYYVREVWNGTIETDIRQNRMALSVGFEF